MINPGEWTERCRILMRSGPTECRHRGFHSGSLWTISTRTTGASAMKKVPIEKTTQWLIHYRTMTRLMKMQYSSKHLPGTLSFTAQRLFTGAGSKSTTDRAMQWFMSTGVPVPKSIPPGWEIPDPVQSIEVGKLSSDPLGRYGASFADILLRHNVYGWNRLWLMNVSTRTHNLEVRTVSDSNWEPIIVVNTS